MSVSDAARLAYTKLTESFTSQPEKGARHGNQAGAGFNSPPRTTTRVANTKSRKKKVHDTD